jgi:hypothetical protein
MKPYQECYLHLLGVQFGTLEIILVHKYLFRNLINAWMFSFTKWAPNHTHNQQNMWLPYQQNFLPITRLGFWILSQFWPDINIHPVYYCLQIHRWPWIGPTTNWTNHYKCIGISMFQINFSPGTITWVVESEGLQFEASLKISETPHLNQLAGCGGSQL